jgi:hypothetical protein
VYWVRRGLVGCTRGRDGAAAGVRLATDDGAGDRTPAHRAPVQYGPRITGIIVYLYIGQFLSKKRTAQALAELFGTPVCEGTVATMTQRAAEGLGHFLEEVAETIAASEGAGFDETGLRVVGRLHWVHCARPASTPC